MIETLKKYLTHPATILAAVLSIVGITVKAAAIHAFVGAVWAQAGTMFTVASVAAFSLIPHLPVPGWVQSIAIAAAIVAGVLYVLKLSLRVYNRFERRI